MSERDGIAAAAVRPRYLRFRLGDSATATAELLWEAAPRTCAAIVAQLPIDTHAWHGRNSGSEALLLTPKVITDVPQDSTEGATTEHRLGDVLFGFERAGSCHGGAGAEDVSEIAWIYGHAAQACFWLSEHGPPHDKPPFRRVAASINAFARITEENGFYEASGRMGRYGQQRVVVTCD